MIINKGYRKTFLFIFLISLVFVSFISMAVAAPEVEWEKTFGGEFSDEGYSVQQTSDGGYIIVGYTGSFGAENSGVYLIKTDSSGDLEWQRTFGGTGFDRGYSVQQTSDGGYIIVGIKYLRPNEIGPDEIEYTDVYLIKTNSLGEKQWEKTFGGERYDWGYSVQQTKDGGYIVAGTTQSFGDYNVYLIKTKSKGDLEWEKTFGGAKVDMGFSVQQTSDGGYIMTGFTQSFEAGPDDTYLIKTDVNGNLEWQRTFGGTGFDRGYSVQQTSDGGYVITGETLPVGGRENWYVYLIKTNSNGEKQWEKTFGATDGARGYYGRSVQQTTDWGYIIIGHTNSPSRYNLDIYIIKTDSNGEKQWEKTFDRTGHDEGYSVQQTKDGGYIVAGSTTSFKAEDNIYPDVYLIKLAPENTCQNSIKDGDEVGVDCGGSCPDCQNGKSCVVNSDCVSNYCNPNRICSVPSCSDRWKNQDETDIDCGGSCGDCSNGKVCLANSDCQSNYCNNQVCSIRRPVLLVHGIYSNDGMWGMFKEELRKKGYEPYAVGELTNDKGFHTNNGDIGRDFSAQLRLALTRIKERTGAQKVDVIAHSMGGLVTRHYINSTKYRNDIRKLVMLGTPNYGTPAVFSLIQPLLSPQGVPLNDIASHQMEPNSDFLRGLNTNYNSRDVQHYAIAGTDSTIARLIPKLLPDSLRSFSDGIVPVENAQLIGHPCYLAHVSHVDHIGIDIPLLNIDINLIGYNNSKKVIDETINILDTGKANLAKCSPNLTPSTELPVLIPRLLNGRINLDKTITLTAMTTGEALRLLAESTKRVNDDIADVKEFIQQVGWKINEQAEYWNNRIKNTLRTKTKGIENLINKKIFKNIWGGSTLEMKLTTPSGEVIDQFSVNPNVQSVITPTSNMYIIDNAESGQWTIDITGVDVPIEGEDFVLEVFEASRVILLPFDFDIVLANEPVRVTVALLDDMTPISNANVKASITRNSNEIALIDLMDDGLHEDLNANDGIYGNIFVPSDAGAYEVRYNANGELNGEHFELEALTALYINTDSDNDGIVDLKDNCPDIANSDQADTDNNGIGDVCEIKFLRGDSNTDTTVDISDAINTLGFLFIGTPKELICKDAADSNDDGTVDISDAINTLNFLFLGTGKIPQPYPTIGIDSTADNLDCESYNPISGGGGGSVKETIEAIDKSTQDQQTKDSIKNILNIVPKGTLSVSSSPTGAYFYLDGKYKGYTSSTPLIIKELYEGPYTIKFTKYNYETYQTTVNILPGQTTTIKPTLKSVASASPTLSPTPSLTPSPSPTQSPPPYY